MLPRYAFRFFQAPLGLVAIMALLAGCGQTYEVKVNAIQDPEVESGLSYRIEPLDPNKPDEDINYKRAEQLVKTALSGKGMYEAPNPEDAEVVVAIDYGAGVPRKEYRNVDRSLEAEQMARMGAMMGGPYPGRTAVIIPSGQGIETEQVYDKYLTIVARKAKSDQADQPRGPEIWRVDVTVEDNRAGMGRVLPVLAGAATDYIGTDTTSEQKILINDQDEVVDFVKQSP